MNFEEIDVNKFITENYLEYGEYVNLHRVIPGFDGMKPVHRRSLMGIKNVASNSLITTMSAVGEIMGKYHPFGDAAIIDVVSTMARIGAISSEGDFGIRLLETIDAAAPRYNKVGLNKKQLDYYFKLYDYSNMIDGEENKEPENLIIPIPYCLIFGAFNWGFGVSARTPGFTYKSIIEAYYTNNPRALVPNYGYLLNKIDSDLQGLWENGVGRLKLSYRVSRIDDNSISVFGSGELFKPAMSSIKSILDSGAVSLKNESSEKISLKLSRIPRMRVDMDEVFSKVKIACSKSRQYEIKMVKDGEKIVTVGMKDWIDSTINNFKTNYDNYKLDRVNKLRESIEVLLNCSKVGEMLSLGNTDEEILSTCLISESVLKQIQDRSMKVLRDSSLKDEKVNKINAEIQSIIKEDVDEIIKNNDPT